MMGTKSHCQKLQAVALVLAMQAFDTVLVALNLDGSRGLRCRFPRGTLRLSFRPLTQESKEANISTAPRPQLISADPVRVDPKHYIVEAENDRVRVLRVRYGPHEKSVMHGHPAVVAVFLTENHGRFTLPEGRTES